MFSRIFVLDVMERAVKTVAQATLALLTMDGVNVFSLDWGQVAKASLTAGFISILTSIVTAGVRERGTASLVVNPPVAPKE